MTSLTFHCPTKVIHEIGITKKAGQIVKEHYPDSASVLLIADNHLIENKIIEPAIDSLKTQNLDTYIYNNIELDPTDVAVEKASEELSEHRSNIIMAIGGGSTIDFAKGIGLLLSRRGKLFDFAGLGKVKSLLDIPLIAVSTTSGTGSQVSPGAVFTSKITNNKFAVIDSYLAPQIALNDPLMTVTCPEKVTMEAGMDAFAHVVESLVSVKSNPFSDSINLRALKMILNSLPNAIRNGDDVEARDEMLLASTMAGIAMGTTMLGLAHALAMPICGLYKVPHGRVVATLIPHVIKFNIKHCPGKYNKLLHIFEEITNQGKLLDEDIPNLISEFVDKVKVPSRLSDIGVPFSEEGIKQIAEGAFNSPMINFNPFKPNKEELLNMVKTLY